MASNPTMADNLPKVEPFTAEPTEAKRQSSADPQIFRSASNGLSLTGILVGRTFSAKQTVLSPPTEIRLMKPQMQQSEHEVDIASVAELKQYVTSVDQIGFSFASESCKDGTFEGNTVTGNASAENTGDVGSSERRQKITFHARVKTTVFPTAACQLNPGRLSLSKDVILELKSIANLLKEGQNCSERCEAFFNRYGSHVNAGILHFGGVNRCLATYSSETESDRDVTIRMVRDVLSAYCSQNSNFSPDSMVTADYLQSKGASCLAPYETSELEKVSVYMQQNGGSLHMANLNNRLKDWEESLTTSSETWAVVDRGSNVGKDFLGIWGLIPNHKGDFAEPQALAAAMVKGWDGTSGREEEKSMDLGEHGFVMLSLEENKSEEKKQRSYEAILDQLGLKAYHPSHITLQQAMTIGKCEEQFHWKLIKKLLMIDYRARDSLVPDTHQTDGEKADVDTVVTEDVLDDIFGEEVDSDDEKINPLDILLGTFGCCDNILRQALAERMFICKLAIPFLYPHGAHNTFMMSVWALRTIIVEWHDEGRLRKTSVVHTEFPIVTSLRLGDLSWSKSKLMNDVLSDQTHNTFFHRDCSSGKTKKRLADGLVECSWFLPAGSEGEMSHRPVIFLNLRGDGASHPVQIHAINQMSSVVLVIANIEDLGCNSHIEPLAHICNDAQNIIILVTSSSGSPSRQQFNALQQTCNKAIGKDVLEKKVKWLFGFEKGSMKNASELKTDVRKRLSNALRGCNGVAIDKAAALVAKQESIRIDEHEQDCRDGKKHAENIMRHMTEADNIECKEKLLPLRGKPWVEYSKRLKEQYKPCRASPSIKEIEKLKQAKTDMRNVQVQKCSPIGPFMDNFVDALSTVNEDVAIYILHWMKNMLDARSRHVIPDLQRNYHTMWAKLHAANNAYDNDELEALKAGLTKAETNLADASLGLEHIFREMGQMYEAMEESTIEIPKTITERLRRFPKLVARLLLKGNPLELFDGDTSNIPITWIKEVLASLTDIINDTEENGDTKQEDKKLFVVTVLGIQSSGKSTFLNTLFGLQLTVSAGRCTRGAFMHLIPVDKEANLPFGYVVVIDTEGLRGMGRQSPSHDNELATLVVGLGDVTIMNIKGENTAEIKDVLQIAVHALLKMTIVNKQLMEHHACVFVHQNVPAVNATEDMMHESHALQEDLDIMTKTAAEMERKSDIKRFCQIITFDVTNHIRYFPDLWQGQPPMAPASHGYSEKTESVRTMLLDDIGKNQNTFFTTPDLFLHIEDLWKAILGEKFTLSFRNSIELKAYRDVETTCFELDRLFQTSVTIWLHGTAKDAINRCEHVAKLEECYDAQIRDLKQQTRDLEADSITALNTYFDENNLKAIVDQWHQTKINQFRCSVEAKIAEVMRDLRAIKDARHIELAWKACEDRAMKAAKEQADTLIKTEQSVENIPKDKLRREFESMWAGIEPQLIPGHISSLQMGQEIQATVEGKLRERFRSDDRILLAELARNPLENNIQHDFMQFESSIGQHVEGSEQCPYLSKSQVKRQVLQEIVNYLGDLRFQDVMFHESYILEVLGILTKHIKEHNQTDSGCMIQPNHEIELAIYIARYCVSEFKSMQLEYEQKHGVRVKLEGCKQLCHNYFENTVRQRGQERVAADLFCDKLNDVVKKAVDEKLSHVVNGVFTELEEFPTDKMQLLHMVMNDLAKAENFEAYMQYIRNAKKVALQWITGYTKDQLSKVIKDSLKKVVECISTSVKHATNECKEMGLEQWIRVFCDNLMGSKVTKGSFDQVLARCGDVDIINMAKIIEGRVQNMENMPVNVFTTTVPYQAILEQLWGCEEQCVFCGEPCMFSNKAHAPALRHKCLQHRPMGLGGLTRDKTRELSMETCGYAVQTFMQYRCDQGKNACRKHGQCTTKELEYVLHHFCDYWKYLEEWAIDPDPENSVSGYWQWFMGKFSEQIKEHYNAAADEMPPTWKYVSKATAHKCLSEEQVQQRTSWQRLKGSISHNWHWIVVKFQKKTQKKQNLADVDKNPQRAEGTLFNFFDWPYMC